MANNLYQEQKKWILKQYWKCENAEQVRIAWQGAFNTPSPSRQAIYHIRNKFERTGLVVNLLKSGHPKTSMTEENEMRVALTVQRSPHDVLLWNYPYQECPCNAECVSLN